MASIMATADTLSPAKTCKRWGLVRGRLGWKHREGIEEEEIKDRRGGEAKTGSRSTKEAKF